MKPLTKELKEQIEASGKPMVRLTFEEFKKSIKGKTSAPTSRKI